MEGNAASYAHLASEHDRVTERNILKYDIPSNFSTRHTRGHTIEVPNAIDVSHPISHTVCRKHRVASGNILIRTGAAKQHRMEALI